jgi:4-hydroxythreonine-4-phosphate dehydrogenase
VTDRHRPRIGISLGDPSGIGPEVVLAAIRHRAVRRALVPILFGDASVVAGSVEVRPVSQLSPRDRQPGKPSRIGGLAQWAYITAVIEAARQGELDGVCTAPVSKEAISRAGVPFMGHTEVFAEAFRSDVLMMMDGPRLRVALATNHLPISAVPAALNRRSIARQLLLLDASLRPVLNRRPNIAVCGLNPHAGEGGLLGSEEQKVIAPAIADAKRRGVRAEGPFAADGLFAKVTSSDWDVVLAMFHDQGLVATKALDFARTVNVTLGLPIPRTSPDHGVAYDIAGKHQADPLPMISALLKAAELARAASNPGSLSNPRALRHSGKLDVL